MEYVDTCEKFCGIFLAEQFFVQVFIPFIGAGDGKIIFPFH